MRKKVQGLLPGAIQDLERLVSHPSVAFPGFPPEPVHAACREVVDLLRRRGFSNAAPLDVGGRYPAVWAEMPAPPGKPTVFLYAHYDVQPAPPEQGWQTDPWALTRKPDGRLYGRGAADNKSGIVLHAAALQVFDGRPPVGLVLCVEGEEETLSALEGFVRAHPERFQADAMLIADMGNLVAGEPVLTTTLRGHVQCDLAVETLKAPLHSGVFGGVAPDALIALARILASLHDDKGNTAVQGLKTGDWRGASFPEDLYRAQSGMLPGVEPIGEGSVAARLWCKPSVTVIGLDAPAVEGAANVLLPRARARVALRTAPGEDPAHALGVLTSHLRTAAPWGVRVSVTPVKASEAFLSAGTGPARRAAVRALREAFGREPSEAGCGGSIPLLTSLAQAAPGAEVLLWGAEDTAASRIHGPDESVDPGELERMILAEALLLQDLAEFAAA